MEENNFILIFLLFGAIAILFSSIFHKGSFFFQLFLIILVFIILCALIVLNRGLIMFNRLKINRLSKKACEFLNNEDYDNASLLYDEILELDSNNINALYNKSLVYFNKKQYSKSLDLLDDLLEIQENFDAILLKGRNLIFLNNFEDGLNCYKNSLNRGDFDLLKYLDEITYFGNPIVFKDNKMMFEISLSLCDFYLEKNSDVFVSYYKGHALSNLGRLEEAVDAFSLTLSLDPSFIFAYSTESEILFKMGRYDDALALLDYGLKIHPEGKLNYNKSLILYRLDEFDEALTYINKYLESESEDEDGIELKNQIEAKSPL